MKALKKVLIFGGTHGNEWTGVKIVKHYENYFKTKFPALDLHFILANPEAYKINRRFKDEDLNRAFQFVNEVRPGSYENARAKELKKLIDAEPCYVIDLHTTTTNMGRTVILTSYDSFNLQLCSNLVKKFSDCRIIGSTDTQRKYLASQSDYGMIVEVGPVANNVVDPKILEGTIELIEQLLHDLTAQAPLTEGALEIYQEIEDVYYPVDNNGEDTAYIHSSLQGKDFVPLNGAYYPFTQYGGEHIRAETNEELYPIFINEAAYYPQHLAYSLCRKLVRKY